MSVFKPNKGQRALLAAMRDVTHHIESLRNEIHVSEQTQNENVKLAVMAGIPSNEILLAIGEINE